MEEIFPRAPLPSPSKLYNVGWLACWLRKIYMKVLHNLLHPTKAYPTVTALVTSKYLQTTSTFIHAGWRPFGVHMISFSIFIHRLRVFALGSFSLSPANEALLNSEMSQFPLHRHSENSAKMGPWVPFLWSWLGYRHRRSRDPLRGRSRTQSQQETSFSTLYRVSFQSSTTFCQSTPTSGPCGQI